MFTFSRRGGTKDSVVMIKSRKDYFNTGFLCGADVVILAIFGMKIYIRYYKWSFLLVLGGGRGRCAQMMGGSLLVSVHSCCFFFVCLFLRAFVYFGPHPPSRNHTPVPLVSRKWTHPKTFFLFFF